MAGQMLTKNSDLFLAIGVIGILVLMIIPLPPALLDVTGIVGCFVSIKYLCCISAANGFALFSQSSRVIGFPLSFTHFNLVPTFPQYCLYQIDPW